MKRLMVLGSLAEFVRLVQLAKNQGIYTVVCDGYEEGPAKKIADISYTHDIRDVEGIAEICKKEYVDGIITSFSDVLFEQMVKIADKAGLPCYLKPDKLSFYRDKSKAKELLQELGIGVAKYKRLKKDFYDQDLDDMKFPLVVKPVTGYGSKGIYIIHQIEELREKFDAITQFADEKDILVEEYCDGHEFNMMAWVIDGEIHVISIADREKTMIDSKKLPVLSRVAYPSRFIHRVEAEAKSILQKFAQATGQREGALSMQFFWREGQEIQVCEIAGRLFGYEHELVTYCCGFDIEQMLLNYVYDKNALCEMFKEHTPYYKKYYAGIYYIGEEHRIQNQDKVRAIADWDNVIESLFFYNDGERVDLTGMNPYIVRYYISGNTREELDFLTKKIYESAVIYDDEGNNLLFPYQLNSR